MSDRKDITLLAEATRLHEMEHLSWTKIAERLALPGRAQAMRSWLYQQLVNEDRKHPPAPAELLDHLRLYPAHALGKFRQGEICADCERLGLNAAVCFECGRMGFAQLYKHLLEKHPGCADDVYRDKHKYNRTSRLVSSEYQRRRSKENYQSHEVNEGQEKASPTGGSEGTAMEEPHRGVAKCGYPACYRRQARTTECVDPIPTQAPGFALGGRQVATSR